MNLNHLYTCCFTGHRPDKFAFALNKSSEQLNALRTSLEHEITDAIQAGFYRFISGGGLGIDLLAAELVLGLKSAYPQIVLLLYLPCKNHYSLWSAYDKQTFWRIRDNADEVSYITQGEYSEGCMQKRNIAMVDDSSRIIAVFNGTSGGTKNTVEYAKKTFIDIRYI